jgi:hypothetical protein
VKVVTGIQARLNPLLAQPADVMVEVEYPVETVYVLISVTKVVLKQLAIPLKLEMVKISVEYMVDVISPEAVGAGGVSTADDVVTMLRFKFVFVCYPCGWLYPTCFKGSVDNYYKSFGAISSIAGCEGCWCTGSNI